MVALSDIAAIIVAFTNTFANFIYFILTCSYFIGKTLASLLSQLGTWISQSFSSFKILIQVLFEDYLIFLEDIASILATTLAIIKHGIISLFENIILGVYNIKLLIENCILLCLLFVNELSNFFHKIILIIIQSFIDIRTLLISFGSFVYYCVKSVPPFLFNLLTEFQKFIISLINNIYIFHVNIFQKFTMFNNKILRFFIDVPIDSVLGLILGTSIIYLFIRHFSLIISKLELFITAVYSEFITLVQLLWTGNFLITEPVEEEPVRPEVPRTVLVNEGDSLCVVCQDQPKAYIIFPCKHMCLCFDCLTVIRQRQGVCPICRSQVRRTMKVYT